MGEILKLFLFVALALNEVNCSCFGTDASWQLNAKPTITQPSKNDPEKVMVTWGNIIKNVNTQPSKNDPEKVMVTWGNIIKNVKCVDKFFVWVWPDGTQKTGSTAKN